MLERPEQPSSSLERVFQPRHPNWERAVRESFARQTFMALIGARIASLEPGRVTLDMPFRRDLCQQRGFVHGGVTTALADVAAGYAAFSLMPANSSSLTVELKINLLAPAIGDRFLAMARVLRSGRTLSVVEVDVVGETGGERKAIARMLATMICQENTSDEPLPGGL